MKCNKARKWMALYREGERKASVEEKLRRHLAECESCNQRVQDYLKNDKLAEQIRSQIPVGKNEDVITNRIMHAIDALQKRPGEAGFAALPDRIVGLAMMPAVRRMAVACILIIAALFAYQQAYIYSNTAKLENQLSAAGKSGLANSASEDMQDCMKKSARYLSGIKTRHVKIIDPTGEDFSENPEVLMQYASFICTHKYKYLETTISRDALIIPDFLMNRALENIQK